MGAVASEMSDLKTSMTCKFSFKPRGLWRGGLDSWWAVSVSVSDSHYELPQYRCIASHTVPSVSHGHTDLGNFPRAWVHQAFSATSPGGPERIFPLVVGYIQVPACWRMLVWPFVEVPYPVVPRSHPLGACGRIRVLVAPECPLCDTASSGHLLLYHTSHVLILASFKTLPEQSSQDEPSIDRVSARESTR